jgi:protein involved in temperature-dependent protein secretion
MQLNIPVKELIVHGYFNWIHYTEIDSKHENNVLQNIHIIY